MRLLLVADLHGAKPYIPKEDFDAVLVPGDVCSDGVKKYLYGVVQALKEGKQAEWYELAGKRRALAGLRRSVRDGRRVLERIAKLGKPVYAIPGNWDWTGGPSAWKPETHDYWKRILRGLPITDVDGKRRTYGGVQLIGYGECNGPELLRLRGYKGITKQQLARNERAYKRLLARYDRLFANASKPTIFLCHNVPYGTRLDRIRNKASPMDGKHYGSVLARDIIRRHKPLLTVSGHIHEGRGVQKLGRTVCVNTGFGPGVATIVDLDTRVRQVVLFDGGRRRVWKP